MSVDEIAITFTRPGPSPAAPSGEEARPPGVRAAALAAKSSPLVAVSISASIPDGQRAPAGHELVRAELEHELLVLRRGDRDDRRPGAGGELHRERADAAVRADHGDALAGRRRDALDQQQRRDAGEHRRAGRVHPDAVGDRGHEPVGGDDDALGPGAVVDVGPDVRHEAEDLVANGEPAGRVLDDAGEVAAEGHREAVLGHALQVAGDDRVVDRVRGGRLDAHQELAVAGDGIVEVLQRGRGVERGEHERLHGVSFRSGTGEPSPAWRTAP